MPYSEYSKKQKGLAAVAPPRKKITQADVKGATKMKTKVKKTKGYRHGGAVKAINEKRKTKETKGRSSVQRKK